MDYLDKYDGLEPRRLGEEAIYLKEEVWSWVYSQQRVEEDYLESLSDLLSRIIADAYYERTE